MQFWTRWTLTSSASRSRRQRRLAGAFVHCEDDSKITSTPYLTVDQGTTCAGTHYPGSEAKIMPDPEFTLAPGRNNWMQDFAWDPLKDEIFVTQNIRSSNGRQTIKINRLGRADDQCMRHFISSITLTDAGHGDVLGPQHKGNAHLLWVNWSQRSGSSIRFRVWLTRSLHPADPFIDYLEWSSTSRLRRGRRADLPSTCPTYPRVHGRGPPPGAGPRSTSGLGR
jgi:hypothetical protein